MAFGASMSNCLAASCHDDGKLLVRVSAALNRYYLSGDKSGLGDGIIVRGGMRNGGRLASWPCMLAPNVAASINGIYRIRPKELLKEA